MLESKAPKEAPASIGHAIAGWIDAVGEQNKPISREPSKTAAD
jgi:Zn-dependent alcohol dehydrogenase